MFRKTVNGDIRDEDFKKILIPFNDNYNDFLENYIMTEVIAFYIANSFYRDAMWKGSFKQHYNSATNVINFFNEDYEKDKVKETTFYNYGNKKLYLEPLYKIKLKDFNIM